MAKKKTEFSKTLKAAKRVIMKHMKTASNKAYCEVEDALKNLDYFDDDTFARREGYLQKRIAAVAEREEIQRQLPPYVKALEAKVRALEARSILDRAAYAEKSA